MQKGALAKQEQERPVYLIDPEKNPPRFSIVEKIGFGRISRRGEAKDWFGRPLRLNESVRLLTEIHDAVGPTDEEWRGYSPCDHAEPSPKIEGYRQRCSIWQVALTIGGDRVWVSTNAVASWENY